MSYRLTKHFFSNQKQYLLLAKTHSILFLTLSNLISLIITKTLVYIYKLQIRMRKNGLFNTKNSKVELALIFNIKI